MHVAHAPAPVYIRLSPTQHPLPFTPYRVLIATRTPAIAARVGRRPPATIVARGSLRPTTSHGSRDEPITSSVEPAILCRADCRPPRPVRMCTVDSDAPWSKVATPDRAGTHRRIRRRHIARVARESYRNDRTLRSQGVPTEGRGGEKGVDWRLTGRQGVVSAVYVATLTSARRSGPGYFSTLRRSRLASAPARASADDRCVLAASLSRGRRRLLGRFWASATKALSCGQEVRGVVHGGSSSCARQSAFARPRLAGVDEC